MSDFISCARRYCDPSCLLVGWFVRSRAREHMLGAQYLVNGCRQRIGYNGLPIVNDTSGIKWPRAR